MTESRKFTIITYTNEATDFTAWENWLSNCPVDHVVQSELFNEPEAIMEAATNVAETNSAETTNSELQQTEPQTESEAA